MKNLKLLLKEKWPNLFIILRAASRFLRVQVNCAKSLILKFTIRFSSDSIRINLGCGYDKLPGYVNIDIDKNCRPDVISVIDSLPFFKNSSVDEIISIHLIEHLYKWHVMDALREWYRILKPNGKLIIECPNIAFVCSWLLDSQDFDENPNNLGINALYGDPSYRDPHMTHKWGYTPVTLEILLRKVGFREVIQKVAETHVKERDFRIEAKK